MTPERWKRLEALYWAARERPSGDLDTFLADACRDDPSLGEELRSLLAQSEAGLASPLDTPLPKLTPARSADASTRADLPRGFTPPYTIDHGQFEPGVIIGSRYRIVSLLGRGGMGEVYRSDDLRLGLPVALKFLPRTLERDPARWLHLYDEVRLARDVSHPNVCRVYDIGEHDSRVFLSMEYVDGEDLAAALRRFGRLPEERAMEIARQICAGLAAAHDRGIIHRDLKPSNIMIDRAGTARLMDFGIATSSRDVRGLAGTPAYMAPEQVVGQPATTASDIYSLGLVLYELFAGQPAVVADTLAARQQRATMPLAMPTEIVPTLSPTIESAIMSCLEVAPERRPASARMVSARLLGGDALARAVAAGETPSPDLVAAAGQVDAALTARSGLAWAAVALAGLFAAAWASDRATVVGQVGLEKPVEVLTEAARHVRAVAGLADASFEARGFVYDRNALAAAIEGRGTSASRAAFRDHPPVRFWLRTSHQRIAPASPTEPTSLTDPPFVRAGDAAVQLDPDGRLLTFTSVVGGGPVEFNRRPDWGAFFAAAGLDRSQFIEESTPVALPAGSERVVWQGPSLRPGGPPLRVEATSHTGRPVSFAVAVVSGSDVAAPSLAADIATTLSAAISAVLAIAAVWLAVVNLRSARADHDGALRVAYAAFALSLLRWLMGPGHTTDAGAETLRLYYALGFGLLNAVVVYGVYLGLEPFVRRFWPRALLGWTRCLRGRIGDPIVGREVLVGLAFGFLNPLAMFAYQLLPRAFGAPEPAGWLVALPPIDGVSPAVAVLAQTINWSIINGLIGLFVVAVIRHYVPGTVAGLGLATLIFALLGDPMTSIDFGRPSLFLTLCLATLPVAVVLLRYGLLAGVAAACATNAVGSTVFTLDRSRVFFQSSLLAAVLMIGLVLSAWMVARGRARRLA